MHHFTTGEALPQKDGNKTTIAPEAIIRWLPGRRVASAFQNAGRLFDDCCWNERLAREGKTLLVMDCRKQPSSHARGAHARIVQAIEAQHSKRYSNGMDLSDMYCTAELSGNELFSSRSKNGILP